MTKPTVLYVCHNHPSVRPGGAEAYALELHRAMRASGEFTPLLLAKGGPPVGPTGGAHGGTPFAPVGDDGDEYFVYTDGYDFDWLFGTLPGKDFYTRHFRAFLQAYRPDVVHFQHTLFLGYDLLREVRNTLPDVPIVYTLHEFLPICHRQGQMVRTGSGERCDRASPRRCHECFPEISPQTFFLRERFIQSHLSLVDVFLAPSRFLLERYVDWGIPRDRIRFEEYGRLRPERVAETRPRAQRDRFGFFGQLNPFKGVDVLLEAMRLLGTGGDATGGAHLWVHGANLDLQEGAFQNRFRELVEATKDQVTLVGRYDHGQLPRLMENVDWVVVPSVWWENSPLVIQEAFLHGRPVICSDVGGMAEKVDDGVNGLHFPAGDPIGLSRVLAQAASTTGLWERLRSGLPAIYTMDEHVQALQSLYTSLLMRRSEGVAHAR